MTLIELVMVTVCSTAELKGATDDFKTNTCNQKSYTMKVNKLSIPETDMGTCDEYELICEGE